MIKLDREIVFRKLKELPTLSKVEIGWGLCSKQPDITINGKLYEIPRDLHKELYSSESPISIGNGRYLLSYKKCLKIRKFVIVDKKLSNWKYIGELSHISSWGRDINDEVFDCHIQHLFLFLNLERRHGDVLLIDNNILVINDCAKFRIFYPEIVNLKDLLYNKFPPPPNDGKLVFKEITIQPPKKLLNKWIQQVCNTHGIMPENWKKYGRIVRKVQRKAELYAAWKLLRKGKQVYLPSHIVYYDDEANLHTYCLVGTPAIRGVFIAEKEDYIFDIFSTKEPVYKIKTSVL